MAPNCPLCPIYLHGARNPLCPVPRDESSLLPFRINTHALGQWHQSSHPLLPNLFFQISNLGFGLKTEGCHLWGSKVDTGPLLARNDSAISAHLSKIIL